MSSKLVTPLVGKTVGKVAQVETRTQKVLDTLRASGRGVWRSSLWTVKNGRVTAKCAVAFGKLCCTFWWPFCPTFWVFKSGGAGDTTRSRAQPPTEGRAPHSTIPKNPQPRRNINPLSFLHLLLTFLTRFLMSVSQTGRVEVSVSSVSCACFSVAQATETHGCKHSANGTGRNRLKNRGSKKQLNGSFAVKKYARATVHWCVPACLQLKQAAHAVQPNHRLGACRQMVASVGAAHRCRPVSCS